MNANPTSDALLSLRDVRISYGGVTALDGVSFDVKRGEVVALLGSNGSGKTTALRAVSGLLDFHGGSITGGAIAFQGEPLPRAAARRVRLGIAQVLEGRRIFQTLSVQDNLLAGAFSVRSSKARSATLDRMYAMFPYLKTRRHDAAGALSGGQQQMVAIARALMSSPRLLLLDEPSLGLAPKVVDQVAEIILAINTAGTSILLVEQNAALALRISHAALILETGRVALSGLSSDLRENPKVRDIYLGMTGQQRRSFKRDTQSAHS